MSVGDLKNNVRKLTKVLRDIKYEKELDIDSLSKGQVSPFLPIYHYLFVEYSRPVGQFVLALNIELAGKTDLRFIEAMYKVLREGFSFKPPITKDQFFSNGFAERKVMMCTDIIGLVKSKHRSLTPKTSKTRVNSGQATRHMGPRPLATVQSTENNVRSSSSVAVPPCLPSTSKQQSIVLPRPNSPPNTGINVHVVQEIHNAVSSSLGSVGGSTAALDTAGVRSVTINPVPQVMDITGDSDTDSRRGLQDSIDTAPWQGMRAVVVTPGGVKPAGDIRPNIGLGYNPAAYGTQDDSDLSDDGPSHPRPIDIVPMTPARPPQAVRVSPVTEVTADTKTADTKTSDAETAADHNHGQVIQDLITHIQGLENRLSVAEGLLAAQQQQLQQRQQQQQEQPVITPQQLETLVARITLLEGKMALYQAQQEAPSQRRGPRTVDPRTEPVSNGLPLVSQPQASFAPPAPLPPGLSPIVHRPSPTAGASIGAATPSSSAASPAMLSDSLSQTAAYDRRWSSTPNGIGAAHGETAGETGGEQDGLSQVERIRNMMKSTETLLNIQVLSPAKPVDNHSK